MNELIKKISFASGISEEEIHEKVEKKKLSGISEEGAAYMVAKDMGIELVQQERLKISSVIAGMQNIDVVGKITKITPIREFKTEKAEGRVVNVYFADETGSTRLVLWNDETDKIKELKEGEVIRVKGYVKESLSSAEIRLGRHGLIAKSNEKIDVVQRTADRSNISELREGQYRQLRTAVVQMFEGNVFYEVCPECKARLKEENDYKCGEHGEVEPEYGIIISCIIDDGTGNIRAVFFNKQAEKIIGMDKKEAKKLFDRKKKLSAVLEQVKIGEDILLTGKVRNNNFFGRLEFIVNDVQNVDTKKEIELMIGD